MFTKIVLATDGSKHSLRATEYTIEPADRFAGTIEVVCVIDEKRSNVDVIHDCERAGLEKINRLKISMGEELLRQSNIIYDIHMFHREAVPTLIRFIDDHGSNCIVIGRRGLSNLQTFLLGSVSHTVAKRTPCLF